MDRKKLTIEDIQKAADLLRNSTIPEFRKLQIYPADLEFLERGGCDDDVKLLIAGNHPFAELSFWPETKPDSN